MKNYTTPLQLVRYARAFADDLPFEFRVAAVSATKNSFGLRGHVLVARDGTAYEVGRSGDDWTRGDDLLIPRGFDGKPNFIGCELPRAVGTCPANVLAELYAD